ARRAPTTSRSAPSCPCGRSRSASRIPRSPRSSAERSEPHEKRRLAAVRGASSLGSLHERLVDLLAGGADGELLGVAPRRPLLPAEGAHGLARDGGLDDLVLLHVVREALVIAGFARLLLDELFEFAVENGGSALFRAVEWRAHAESVIRAGPLGRGSGQTRPPAASRRCPPSWNTAAPISTPATSTPTPIAPPVASASTSRGAPPRIAWNAGITAGMETATVATSTAPGTITAAGPVRWG